MGWLCRLHLGALLALLAVAGPALASPWAEVGDSALRSDIEILAAAGVIDDVTSQWPLPWTAIARRIESTRLAGQSEPVREAAERVLTRAHHETADGWQAGASVDLTNRANVVYDFGGLGRGDAQSQVSLTYNDRLFSGRLALGIYSPGISGRGTLLNADDSYVATKLGGALLYAGQVSHWWGPGWISALSLSNNALPMPQIGIERLDTSAFKIPLLRWLGPWQAEFFVGLLDGPRVDDRTLYNALRVTFNPAPGLQIGLARTQEFCGAHHVCDPLRGYFDLNNDPTHTDITNDEGLIDIEYKREIAGLPVSAYMQLMNEDSSPFTHSGTSHLFGAALWRMIAGHVTRFSAEYADSVATSDIFSFGDVLHGFAYPNYTYTDGMRYRGRTLGFSLDTDSRLLSLQMAWSDDGGRFYQFSLHHAMISDPLNPLGNVVTTAPVLVNLGEVRVSMPLPTAKLDLAVRLQDDQPRPDRGFAVGFEAAVHFAL